MTQALFDIFANSISASSAQPRIEEVPFSSHFHFVIKPSKQKAFAAFLKPLGLTIPTKGMSHASGNSCILNINPNQFWLINLSTEALTINETTVSQFGWLIDFTGSRFAVRLSGDGVQSKLSRLAPIDFHEAQFKPGMLVDTVCASIPLTIWRDQFGPSFYLAVPSSFKSAFEHELAFVCERK
jgi:heterotetrameric sarcosine oxidase gamma subunit